ncbi:branched-chain amino acid ABC transporter substrate-binding protein [Hydrogenibacillus schlegelii]|nr:branched-chain amino acid ABC transporter substrate-binding protein [Hydrogenibacillus schlegelii]MBT9282482.1 branched-chain amino acid ABC transporter substrate-binding protein [Hydrogenibacillus schlegelii]
MKRRSADFSSVHPAPRRLRPGRRTITGLALLAFVLLGSGFLSACGGKTASTDGPPSGQTAGEATGGSSGGEILIGVQSPTTGSEAKMGQDINQAIELAVEELNAKGGVLGKTIKLTFADDACDPQTATAAANKLVSQGVVAVVGGYCSGATLPATGVYHQAGIPMVVTAANSEKIPAQGYPEIFLVNGTTKHQAKRAAEYMVKEQGAKRIALVHDNSAFARDLAEATKQEVEALGGEVIAFEAVNSDENDFTPVISKLKSLKPDATYWTAYYSAGGLFIKQFKTAKVPGIIGVGDGANDKMLVAIAGKENAEGTFITMSPSAEFIPEAKAFIERYYAKYGEEPGPYSALSYDGMRLLADAIERAGSTEPAAIVRALRETKDFPVFGGTITFNPDGTIQKSNFIVVVVKNGEFALP